MRPRRHAAGSRTAPARTYRSPPPGSRRPRPCPRVPLRGGLHVDDQVGTGSPDPFDQGDEFRPPLLCWHWSGHRVTVPDSRDVTFTPVKSVSALWAVAPRRSPSRLRPRTRPPSTTPSAG